MTKIPRHKEISDDLLAKIRDGIYPEASMIPKEVDLALIYGASRPTVRQAIQTLAEQGYLERTKKKGTFVRQKKFNQEFTQIIESFDSEMQRKGLVPKTTTLLFTSDAATAEVADKLKIAEGAAVYKLIRLRFIENDPVVLVTTYLPQKLLPGLANYDFASTRLYSVLTELQMPVQKITRRLDVIKADSTTADLLNIADGEPLFYFHSVGCTYNDVPVEYSISRYRGDKNSFVFEIINKSR